MEAAEERLASWFASQLPDAQDVWVEGLDHVDSGHSAEMLSLTIRGFEDRAIQAWVIESHAGTVQYVDGGITNVDGTLSKRFVAIEHDTGFDGDRKRPAQTTLVFTDEDGETYRVTGESAHQHVGVYYGQPLDTAAYVDHGGGEYFLHFAWDGSDRDELVTLEDRSMSIDQLMRFELDGMVGHGIFEILTGGQSSRRYLANWPAMDMTPFRQRAKSKERT